MAIAAIPGVGQLAESTKPPFHKSFLVVDLLNAQEFASAWSKPKIAFSIFGVDEERTTTQADHPATPPSLDPDGMKLGSYLIDEVIVEFPGTPEGEADDTENAEVPSQGTAGVAAPAARFEVEAGDG
jgi:hypothetical protein